MTQHSTFSVKHECNYFYKSILSIAVVIISRNLKPLMRLKTAAVGTKFQRQAPHDYGPLLGLRYSKTVHVMLREVKSDRERQVSQLSLVHRIKKTE